MKWLWHGVRGVLSLTLTAIAAVMCWVYLQRPLGTEPLAVAAAALFLAALPWVRIESGNRALALSGVVLGLALVILSLQGVWGAGTYPRQCAVGRWWCMVENLLHMLGGPWLVVLPYLLCGVLLLHFSLRALWHGRR